MQAARARYDAIDALRGVAIVWMTVFHFCFDLNFHGWLHLNLLGDPVWVWQRNCIVSLFLFCAGLGQAVAVEQGQPWPRFWRRWAQVAGCALLVSVGSWLMFPQRYIYFGVLHGIAVMLILVRAGAGAGRWLWLLGILAIALKFIAEYAHGLTPNLQFLDGRMWNWLGLIREKPQTEDYVPLIPWLGPLCFGLASGRWLLRAHSEWLQTAPAPRPLAWLGRWSLSYYMLHQPVLLGLLWLVQMALAR